MVDILSDRQREAEQIANQGIELCQEENLEEAHKLFLQAYEMDPASAKASSWLGYTTAMVERKVQKGLDYARKAVDSNIPDAMFYRNMGVIYLELKNKRGAIGAFAKGLQIDKGNREILKEWSILGFRRKVTFSSLDRSHFLNRIIGRFTYWLTNRNK